MVHLIIHWVIKIFSVCHCHTEITPFFKESTVISKWKDYFPFFMSGLHGYQANLVLRNMRNELWSQHFRNIFCRMEDVTSGCARFTLVQHDSVADHSPLTRKLNMPWKTELFKGVIEVSYGHFQNFNELKNSYLNNENGCWIFF